MLEKMEKYYMELSNTINIFNDNNNTTLSNVNIWEALLKVIIEDEEESITGYCNVTADAFSYAPSSQRENLNAIFTRQKLENRNN